MKITFEDKGFHDITAVHACLEVKYWNTAMVNGIVDDGSKIPLRKGDYWNINVDVETGKIKDWPVGTTAEVEYSVTDKSTTMLLDGQKVIADHKGRSFVNCFNVNSSSEYFSLVSLTINEDGKIENWNPIKHLHLVKFVFGNPIYSMQSAHVVPEQNSQPTPLKKQL